MNNDPDQTRRFDKSDLDRRQTLPEKSKLSDDFVKSVQVGPIERIRMWVEEMNASDPRPHPRGHPCNGCSYLYPVWMACRTNATAISFCTRFPPTVNVAGEASFPDVTKLPRSCGEYSAG
jgi:hypothetical protein